MWTETDFKKPIPEDLEVLGFHNDWIHPDFNPSGIRVGFMGADGFISARWNDSQDTYLNGEGMPTKWMKIPIKYDRLEKIFDKLFEEIKHGDPEHQKWLRSKIDEFLNKLIF